MDVRPRNAACDGLPITSFACYVRRQQEFWPHNESNTMAHPRHGSPSQAAAKLDAARKQQRAKRKQIYAVS